MGAFDLGNTLRLRKPPYSDEHFVCVKRAGTKETSASASRVTVFFCPLTPGRRFLFGSVAQALPSRGGKKTLVPWGVTMVAAQKGLPARSRHYPIRIRTYRQGSVVLRHRGSPPCHAARPNGHGPTLADKNAKQATCTHATVMVHGVHGV